jgi:ankyrin repeat protein
MEQYKAALNSGDLQLLRKLVTAEFKPDDANGGLTIFHYAAMRGRFDCIKYFLELGADVNVRDTFLSTPLHLACGKDVPEGCETIRVLADGGAIIDATEIFESTPLRNAIYDKNDCAARLLLDCGAKLANIKLDADVPAIPDWVFAFIESRSNCRCAAITMIGIHKYHLTTITVNNDTNVLKLIGKHIWSMRMGWDVIHVN